MVSLSFPPSSPITKRRAKSKDKSFLRFITCGSVDDGKSTLIGRLLYDSRAICEDHLKILEADSKKHGKSGKDLDFALLVDGLEAEREQGITIDVAYRFFSTDKRRFIIADTPGHEQYTCNMATGASLADLAIVIVDARKGVLTQTRRHSLIVSLFGVKNVVFAINKMDLVEYDEKIFKNIESDIINLAKILNINNVQCIPISALYGDNVVYKSSKMLWYEGSPLLTYLDEVEIETNVGFQSFCMPVQWVNHPNQNFRGFSGTLSSGMIKQGDKIKVLPAGLFSTVSQIVSYDGNLKEAHSGQPVTIILKDEIDISRGDVLTSADNSCDVADQFEANILWMSQKEMVLNRQYVMQMHTAKVFCTPNKLKHKIDINSFEEIQSKSLSLNELGVCNIALSRPIPFVSYGANRELGSFILVDRITNETVAAGTIKFSLRRATNVHFCDSSVNQIMRSSIKGHKACVVWMTGLSGAGKSTIANFVEKKLNESGKHTMLLDGDNLRLGINKDLSFSEQDRVENLRRIAEISKLMMDAGLITIVATISPFKAERAMAKETMGQDNFIEVFIDTPLELVEKRDVKGLYKKARLGKIINLTGIGSPYEPPESPDLHLNTVGSSPEDLGNALIEFLTFRGFLK